MDPSDVDAVYSVDFSAAANHDDALDDAEAGCGRLEGRIYAGPG